jgi:hypothetical protein
MAGRAPVCPEVHQDGAFPRSGDNKFLEIVAVNGEGVGVRGMGIVVMGVVMTVIMMLVVTVTVVVVSRRGLEHGCCSMIRDGAWGWFDQAVKGRIFFRDWRGAGGK